jgi:transcriptional regulator with XRE-family HTH domain
MNNLAGFRRKFGISQKELALALGVAQNTVSNWEQGKRQMDAKTLAAAASLFGVSVDELLGLAGPAPAPLTNGEGLERQVREVIAREYGAEAASILHYFDKLNDLGKAKAVETMQDLTQIPRYRAEKASFTLRAARSKGRVQPFSKNVSKKELQELQHANAIKEEKDLK